MRTEEMTGQLQKHNLVELVTQRIAEWLEDGKLKPGDRVPSEQELSELFGVARNVIREAIVALKANGLINVRHGKGTFVSDAPVALLTRRIRRIGNAANVSLRHVWEMRLIIETEVARIAAQRRTVDDLGSMEEALGRMKQAVERGELGTREDEEFHFYLVQATQNPVLEDLVFGLTGIIRSARVEALMQPGNPLQAIEEHKAILAEVRNAKSDAAALAMQRHIEVHMSRVGGGTST